MDPIALWSLLRCGSWYAGDPATLGIPAMLSGPGPWALVDWPQALGALSNNPGPLARALGLACVAMEATISPHVTRHAIPPLSHRGRVGGFPRPLRMTMQGIFPPCVATHGHTDQYSPCLAMQALIPSPIPPLSPLTPPNFSYSPYFIKLGIY